LRAHAVLLDSVPAAGSLTAGPAITVQLRFNSRVDGKRSRIVLITPDGKTYPLDIAPQSSPDILNAPARGLLEGGYKLQWQVLASDGHITRGEVPFRIK
jgi:methionine-rich copper-binding protein CopC